MERLKEELDQALAEGSSVPRARQRRREVERPIEEIDLDSFELKDLPGVVPYRYKLLDTTRSRHIPFHEPSARNAQVGLLETLVRQEQPVTVNYARLRLKNAWGVKREGPLVASACDQAVARLLMLGEVDRVGDTLFINGERRAKQIRVPNPEWPETFRDLVTEVPVEEIELAILTIVEHARGIARDALIQQTGRLFGYGRTSARVADVIGGILERLIAEKRIRDAEGEIIMSEGAT